MKALTIHQPYASLIAAGVKTIETRGRGTDYRGPLLIHAAARIPRLPKWKPGEPSPADLAVHEGDAALCRCGHQAQFCLRLGLCTLPRGAVVSVATVVDVVPTDDLEWVPNMHHATGGACMGWSGGASGPARGVPTIFVCDGQRPLGDFTSGRKAWLLANVRRLREPVPAKGMQAAPWTPDGELVARVLEQVA